MAERITIVLDDVHQLSFKGGGLIIIELEVHTRYPATLGPI
jgi:hypothetical protein